MSRFHTDDQWQKAVRDAVLGPGFYGPFSRDGRYVYIDKARLNLRENGATEEEIEFLLDQRVELNVFASDDLVEWIEGKPEDHGVAKVILDEDCLAGAYRRALEQAFVQQKIDEAEKLGEDAEVPKGLLAKVKEHLDKDSAATWDSIVRDIAEQKFEDDDVGDNE